MLSINVLYASEIFLALSMSQSIFNIHPTCAYDEQFFFSKLMIVYFFVHHIWSCSICAMLLIYFILFVSFFSYAMRQAYNNFISG